MWVKVFFVSLRSAREKSNPSDMSDGMFYKWVKLLLTKISYVSSLQPVECSTERASQKDVESTIKEKPELRSISGQLLWLTSQTHPDTLFHSCRVSSYGKKTQAEEFTRSKQSC